MPTIAHVIWRDACTEEAREGGPVSPDPLIELHEVGWLLAEGEDSITLGMELEADGQDPGRWRLHLPISNIISLHTMEVEEFLKKRKGRKRPAA